MLTHEPTRKLSDGSMSIEPTSPTLSRLPMTPTRPLQEADLLAAYHSAEERLLLFDYDGTLTPIVPDAATAILPQTELCSLAKLAAEPKNAVWIISGRGQQFLHAQLGRAINIGLVAEHGAFLLRPESNDEWENLAAEADMKWKATVRQAFEDFMGHFPGSFIEEKQVAIVLHYRGVKSQSLAEIDAANVKAVLQRILERAAVEIISGKCVLEARPANVNKGQTVQRILLERSQASGGSPDFCFCVGDDVTDEDMFRALHASDLKPGTMFTVTVGERNKVSEADYCLENPSIDAFSRRAHPHPMVMFCNVIMQVRHNGDEKKCHPVIDILAISSFGSVGPNDRLFATPASQHLYAVVSSNSQAIHFLNALLTSGNTSTAKQPAVLPPPHHLSLIATLAVHPTLTTRAKTLDRIHAANLALQYLRSVVRHIGPAPETLGEAFTFAGQGTVARRRVKNKRRTTAEGVSPNSEYTERIDTDLANAGSLWAHAEDFWQVVGWCFNCSVAYKRRWERWRAWLAFMVEVLEMDWEDRYDEMDKSLIVQYINSSGVTPGRERRIVRAVFADGRAKSVAEFGEIWQNETKELKKDSGLRKAEAKIDIEADDYGDYTEDENEGDLEDSTSDPSSPSAEPHSFIDSTPDISRSLGGIQSINLRIRIISLLSKVSATIPDVFTPITTLYHTFFEHIRPLPIPAFFAIMSPLTLQLLDPTAASTLTQYILRSIIAAAAPLPPTDALSQDIFQTSYLPFSANTNSIIDNTKVSLCVETLLRLLDKHCGLEWSPAFHDAAEAGIKARMTKARGKQTKRGTDGEGSCDKTWLASSSERIRLVTEMAKP